MYYHQVHLWRLISKYALSRDFQACVELFCCLVINSCLLFEFSLAEQNTSPQLYDYDRIPTAMTQGSPSTVMPGAFHFSYLDQGSAPKLSGAKSHIFQPPHTPTASASSSLYLTRSATGSAMSTEYQQVRPPTGKKRSRFDYDSRAQTPTRDEELLDPASPMPFVNTRYVIKGGLDTPNLKAAGMEDSACEYSDVGYRRELSGTASGLLGEESGYQSFLTLNLDHDSRSRRTSNQSMNHDGWSKTALEVVGGVVGKVWEFCKTSAFRGFHAGAGRKYTFKNRPDDSYFSLKINEKSWETEQITTTWGDEGEPTPLPGQFPEEDFIPNYMANLTPEPTPPRAGKRRHISRNNTDELARNWVVVPPVDARPSTPSNLQPKNPPRYMQTTSSTSRRSVIRTSRASVVAPRRPLLPRTSHAGSPALTTHQSASYASPRSPGGTKIPHLSTAQTFSGRPSSPIKQEIDSPAAREAAKWAALKKKEEKEADITIRRLDRQLKDLIREGKEALGTRVEIEMEEEDEGFDLGSQNPLRIHRRWDI